MIQNLIFAFSINETLDKVVVKLEGWLETLITMLPNFVIAVLIVLAFGWLNRLICKQSEKLVHRFTHHKSLTNIIVNIIGFCWMSIGVFVALSTLELDRTVTSLLAGVGVVGLALGFAFQETANNFISGFFIAWRRPFKDGDIVKTEDGFFGIVQQISLRTTTILTFDGLHTILPNTYLFQKAVINYTNTNIRRVDLEVGVSYGENLPKVKQVTLNAVQDIKERKQDYPLEVFFTGFGDSSINLVVRFWADYYKASDYMQAMSEAIINLKQAYNDNDIMIPFPIRTLDFGIKGGEKLNEVIAPLVDQASPKS